MMFTDFYFANPRYLLLLILVPIIVYYLVIISKQLQATLKFPSTDVLKQNRTNFTKIRPIIYVFRLLAIILIIISLARPQTKETSTRIKTTRGIDIVMVIDISSSMLAKDLKPNRLSALKNVAANFVDNRPNDRIGLVVYAAESYTKTPVTSDKKIIKEVLSEINYDPILEDGTAIGMGLSTAVNRLKGSIAKSKVIILLTDGVNNSGFIDPRIAAGSNLFIGFFMGALGWVGHATKGNVDYPLLVIMGATALIGSWFGAKLTGKVNLNALILTMGFVLVIVGPLLAYRGIIP